VGRSPLLQEARRRRSRVSSSPSRTTQSPLQSGLFFRTEERSQVLGWSALAISRGNTGVRPCQRIGHMLGEISCDPVFLSRVSVTMTIREDNFAAFVRILAPVLERIEASRLPPSGANTCASPKPARLTASSHTPPSAPRRARAGRPQASSLFRQSNDDELRAVSHVGNQPRAGKHRVAHVPD
jgi:hypothetical protein